MKKDIENNEKTKADAYLKSNQELLGIVIGRLSIPPDDTNTRDLGVMESAIGALFVGQMYGVRVLRILHSSSTLRKYEQFLGASFDELLPQHGEFIDRSYAWAFSKSINRYWDLVARKFKMDSDQKRLIVDTATHMQ